MLRSIDGAYQKHEWTSYSDIGRSFDGIKLIESEYLKVESSYLFVIEEFIHESKINGLTLHSLENKQGTKLPATMKQGSLLTPEQCVHFSRLALRELVWGKLVIPGKAYVHFGYDYYMYIGVPVRCNKAISAAESRGLFVEPFRSPHLRAHSNKSMQPNPLKRAADFQR